MKDDKSKKEIGDLKREYDEKIKKLENKIEDLEKSENESIVESVVGQFLPGFGGIIKTLEKTSPEFKKRIAETDEEIKHRIDVGWSSKPIVEYSFSTRPLGAGARRRKTETKPKEIVMSMPENVPEKGPTIDVFEEKGYITVIAELPGIKEDSIKTELSESYLLISAGDRDKRIELPSIPKSILDKTYKHGILQLKIEKENDGS